jgi:hypothetical protein
VLLRQSLEDGGTMRAHHYFGRGNAELGLGASPQPLRHSFQVAEERVGKFHQLLSRRGKTKRLPIEKLYAQILFKEQNLRAHGWLLDSVRHVPDG